MSQAHADQQNNVKVKMYHCTSLAYDSMSCDYDMDFLYKFLSLICSLNDCCLFSLCCKFIMDTFLANQQEEKGRPLPKFGEWDVNDPASAEGFTVIFNKARDEKKTGGKPESPGKVDALNRPALDPQKAPSVSFPQCFLSLSLSLHLWLMCISYPKFLEYNVIVAYRRTMIMTPRIN